MAAGAAALPGVVRAAGAQGYPARPVRIILGYPAGGSTDLVARIMGAWLTEGLGQSFVIENKPGAGTNLAAQAVVSSAPDGYTLLFVTTTNAINATFYGTLPFNFLHDIAPVAGLVDLPFVMETGPSVPAKTVAEFIAYAKAAPGKINAASFGTGTISHLAWELFKLTTGVDLVHVPYPGGAPMVTDLIAGRVQAGIDALPNSLPHIRAGTLRALAVTGPARSDTIPDVPTVGETVPGYEVSGWTGIGVPAGTPKEIVAALNREINAGLSDARIKARLADVGGRPILLSPQAFGQIWARDTDKWAKVMKSAAVKRG
jgi:tripartite-type tricarboxylate transporter receptor subunit TctC